MTTSINGVALPIKTSTFVATNFLDSVQGVEHNMEFIFFNTQSVDFSKLTGFFDNTTLTSSGDTGGGSPAYVGFFFFVFDNITVDYSNSTAAVRIDLATNPQQGGFAQGDTLINVFSVIGSAFDDVIRGQDTIPGFNGFNDPGENSLFGGAGNDILEGRGGPDLINGGSGSDTASYESSPAAVNVTVNDPVTGAFSASGGDATGDRLISIENLIGSSFNDILTGSSNNNTLDGGLGDDTLDGKGGIDTALYASHDSISLLAAEQDVISLGLNGADGSYTRSGLVGLPIIQFQTVEHDVLRDIEDVFGSNHNETINGNEQDNFLAGRGGNDNLNGGAGNDIYSYIGSFGVAFGNDRIFDDSGTDAITVNSFSDILGAQHVGNDLILTLTGGTIQIIDHFAGHQVENVFDANNNFMVLATGLIGGNLPGIIAGGNGGETLDGRGGDDFLFGGNGSDRLIGGDGNDRLTGGNGQDTFVFGPGFGHDVITDFTPADRIEFDGGVFKDFEKVLAEAQQVGANTVITLDPDNSITLLGVALHSLHASNFAFG